MTNDTMLAVVSSERDEHRNSGRPLARPPELPDRALGAQVYGTAETQTNFEPRVVARAARGGRRTS